MKNIIKRSIVLMLLIGYIFNSNLFNQLREVRADWINAEDYYTYMYATRSGGLPTIFQIVEEKDENGNAPYHYLTVGTTTSSKTNHNVHRTIAIQISRIRDGINPFENPYNSFGYGDELMSKDDPHYYMEVTGNSSDLYDNSWEYITVGGKKYSRQYFTIPLDKAKANEIGITDNSFENPTTGKTINDWIVPYDTLWNQIQYSSGCEGWYDELQHKIANGETYYLGADAVKTWVHLGGNANSTSDDTIHAKYIIYQNSEGGTHYVDYFNDSGSLAVWTWANWQTAVNNSGSGLSSTMLSDYYNKYYRSMVEVAPVEDPKETPVKKTGTFNLTKNEDDNSNTGNTSGSNTTTEQSQNAYAAPGIFTYNDSDTYELGTAIPTSNEYKNGVILDGWYGNVEISQNTYARTEKTSNYAINYSYTVHHPASGKTVTDPDTGKEVAVDDSWDETINGTEYATSSDMIQSTWQGVYTTISDVDLYQLQNATTTNGAGGTISYTENVLTHVPYSITVNGTTYTSGESQNGSDDKQVPTFNASESYHVKENNVDTSRITVSVGNMGDSKPSHDAIISAGKGQVQAIWNKRVKNNASLVTLQNDEFTIDGVTYLTNPSE